MIRIDSAEDFGETLGLLRQLARITPGALAAEFGGNSYRIGEWERGQRSMNIHTAVRLLAALGHQLAIVPLIETAPETALSARVADQGAEIHTEPGVSGSSAAETLSGGAA